MGADCGLAAGVQSKAGLQFANQILELLLVHAGTDNDKFITADPVKIGVGEDRPHPPCTFHQYLIAKFVAVAVVDIF